jgi:hypothetical protein
MANNNSLSPRQIMDRDGWFLQKNVFTPEEINTIRAQALQGIKEGYKCDIFSNPNVAWVLTHQKLVDMAKAVLGTNGIYFGDSTVQYNVYESGFHKDNADRHDPKAPDWHTDYSVYRFALYLQDCAEHSGGITLRTGGHLAPTLNEGKIVNVKTAKGDIVCWKLTMSHSANARILKFAPNWHLHPRIMRRVPMFMCKPYDGERVAMFFTIAAESPSMHRFMDYLLTREYGVNNLKNQNFDPEMIKKAEANGLKIIDISHRLNEIDLSNKNLEHKDLKY